MGSLGFILVSLGLKLMTAGFEFIRYTSELNSSRVAFIPSQYSLKPQCLNLRLSCLKQIIPCLELKRTFLLRTLSCQEQMSIVIFKTSLHLGLKRSLYSQPSSLLLRTSSTQEQNRCVLFRSRSVLQQKRTFLLFSSLLCLFRMPSFLLRVLLLLGSLNLFSFSRRLKVSMLTLYSIIEVLN